MTTESDWLFVYGSLKRGERHHAELRGATFVGEARTVEGYGLEAIGPYLALVERPGQAGSVSGELFEVDEPLLRLLDEFEGDDYRRGVVQLAFVSGSVRLVSVASEVGRVAPIVSEGEGEVTDSSDSREIRLPLAYLKRTR